MSTKAVGLLAILALAACRAEPAAPRFPEAQRKVAPIVSDSFSTEDARDRLGESEAVMRFAGIAPGMSVAVTFAGDDWSEGFGLADVENEVRVTPDTVFRIASITKPISATAVMQLVERGQVSLDDPVQKHVPAFPAKGEHVVTIRHLLSHTSGIRHYKEGEFNHKASYDSVGAALTIFKDDPLLFTPGTKYSYSTYAYNLLAGVVERASGLTFEQYLTEHVLTPAGMTRTYL